MYKRQILDSGMTLSYILELLQARGPRSIKLCTLLDKPERREVNIKPDYSGFVAVSYTHLHSIRYTDGAGPVIGVKKHGRNHRVAENEKNQSARAPAAKGGQGRAARPAENTNGIKQKAPAAQKRPSGTAQKQNGNKSQPQAGKKKPQEAAQKTAQAQKTEHTQKASQKNQQPKQSRGRQKQPSPCLLYTSRCV